MRDWRRWLGVSLVVAGLLRAALLVFGGPLAGYGNQYDMHRTGSCLSLFPAIPAPANISPTPDAPIDRYVKEPSHDGSACYRSTEAAIMVAVASVAHALDADTVGLRLRWVGATKFAILALTALLLAYALHPYPVASVAHGVIVLLVIADPAVTLWLNTLYTEFAILWGLYAAIGCLFALALGARGAPLLWLWLAIALAGLAFSREQFALLPPALIAAAAPWLWRESPSAYALALGVAVVTSMISFGLMPRPASIAEANRSDTYLSVVIPASSNPARALSKLGLPARCAPMIGASWYLQRGEDLRTVCPEVFRLPSTAFLRFAFDEPEVLGRSIARVLPATQAVSPPFLGTLEGTARRGIGELPWWRGSLLHALASRLAGSAFAVAVLATMLAAFAGALLAAGRLLFRREPGPGALLAMLLGGTTMYALLTTAFGDGLSEAARHFLAGWLAMACALVAFTAGAVAFVLRARSDRKYLGLGILGALVAIGAGAWATHGALAWSQRQPLVFGVVDRPVGRNLPPGDLVVEGWALDPAGIERIEVALGELRRAPVRDPHPALPAHVFPGYAEPERARFRATFTAEEFLAATANGPVLATTTVTNVNGVAFELDRRTLDRSR